MNLTTLGTSYEWNHRVPFVTSVMCHLAYVIKVLLYPGSTTSISACMLWHISEFLSFLSLNNIPSYAYTTFCLSIHLPIDTWVASTFWLL